MTLVFAVVLVISSSPGSVLAQADKNARAADFTLVLTTSDDAVHLQCTRGCAWSDLAFDASVGDPPQGVDDYGMTRSPELQGKEDRRRPDFRITIERTEDGVRLEGLRGTAWGALTFRPVPDRGQAIDQNGMTRVTSR